MTASSAAPAPALPIDASAPMIGQERRPSDASALLASLASQQRRVIGIVTGLDDRTMRRAVLPSGWSCAGMVQHLTMTTRFWLVEVMDGRPDDHHLEDEFHVPAATSVASLLDAYQDAADSGAALVRHLPLQTAPAWWPDGQWGDWRLGNLEEVLLHLLVETTCHAGHLDAARELIDGRTWDYALGAVGVAS